MRSLITWMPLLSVAGASYDCPPVRFHGVVKFTGEKPKTGHCQGMLANAFCKDHCGGNPSGVRPSCLWARKMGRIVVANVLVYMSKGLEGKKFDPPQQPVVIDQTNCVSFRMSWR